MKRLWTQSLSATLSLSLLWTSCDMVSAAEALLRASTPGLSALRIPARLGAVTDHFTPASGSPKQVILLQDLHVNYSVQKNIAGILKFLTSMLSSSGVTANAFTHRPLASSLPFVLAVEGASGPLDSSLMALFPDQKVKQAAADYLMEEGEITGAEYFAVLQGLPNALHGVEDATFYTLHRDLFRKTYAERERLVASLTQIQSEILSVKKSIYAKDLRVIDHRLQAFRDGKVSVSRMTEWLKDQARPLGVDVHFSGARDADGDLTLFDRIQQVAFLIMTQKAKTTDEKNLVQVEHDLALLLRVVHLQATEAEVRALAPRIHQFVALADTLLASQRGSKEARKQGSVEKGTSDPTSSPHRSLASSPDIRELITSSIDYYALALSRNKPMVQNTLALLSMRGSKEARKPGSVEKGTLDPTSSPHRFLASSPETAVLVAGGFHTRQITQLLRAQNVGYTVITPNVDKLGSSDHALYATRLNGVDLTPQEILAAAPKVFKKRLTLSHLLGRFAPESQDTLAADTYLGRRPGVRLAALIAMLGAAALYAGQDFENANLLALLSQWKQSYSAWYREIPELAKVGALFTGSAVALGAAFAGGSRGPRHRRVGRFVNIQELWAKMVDLSRERDRFRKPLVEFYVTLSTLEQPYALVSERVGEGHGKAIRIGLNKDDMPLQFSAANMTAPAFDLYVEELPAPPVFLRGQPVAGPSVYRVAKVVPVFEGSPAGAPETRRSEEMSPAQREKEIQELSREMATYLEDLPIAELDVRAAAVVLDSDPDDEGNRHLAIVRTLNLVRLKTQLTMAKERLQELVRARDQKPRNPSDERGALVPGNYPVMGGLGAAILSAGALVLAGLSGVPVLLGAALAGGLIYFLIQGFVNGAFQSDPHEGEAYVTLLAGDPVGIDRRTVIPNSWWIRWRNPSVDELFRRAYTQQSPTPLLLDPGEESTFEATRIQVRALDSDGKPLAKNQRRLKGHTVTFQIIPWQPDTSAQVRRLTAALQRTHSETFGRRIDPEPVWLRSFVEEAIARDTGGLSAILSSDAPYGQGNASNPEWRQSQRLLNQLHRLAIQRGLRPSPTPWHRMKRDERGFKATAVAIGVVGLGLAGFGGLWMWMAGSIAFVPGLILAAGIIVIGYALWQGDLYRAGLRSPDSGPGRGKLEVARRALSRAEGEYWVAVHRQNDEPTDEHRREVDRLDKARVAAAIALAGAQKPDPMHHYPNDLVRSQYPDAPPLSRQGYGDETGSSRTEVALAVSVVGGLMSAAMIGFGSYFAYTAAAAAGTVFAGSVAIPAALAVAGLLLVGFTVRLYRRVSREEKIRAEQLADFAASHDRLKKSQAVLDSRYSKASSPQPDIAPRHEKDFEDIVGQVPPYLESAARRLWKSVSVQRSSPRAEFIYQTLTPGDVIEKGVRIILDSPQPVIVLEVVELNRPQSLSWTVRLKSGDRTEQDYPTLINGMLFQQVDRAIVSLQARLSGSFGRPGDPASPGIREGHDSGARITVLVDGHMRSVATKLPRTVRSIIEDLELVGYVHVYKGDVEVELDRVIHPGEGIEIIRAVSGGSGEAVESPSRKSVQDKAHQLYARFGGLQAIAESSFRPVGDHPLSTAIASVLGQRVQQLPTPQEVGIRMEDVLYILAGSREPSQKPIRDYARAIALATRILWKIDVRYTIPYSTRLNLSNAVLLAKLPGTEEEKRLILGRIQEVLGVREGEWPGLYRNQRGSAVRPPKSNPSKSGIEDEGGFAGRRGNGPGFVPRSPRSSAEGPSRLERMVWTWGGIGVAAVGTIGVLVSAPLWVHVAAAGAVLLGSTATFGPLLISFLERYANDTPGHPAVEGAKSIAALVLVFGVGALLVLFPQITLLGLAAGFGALLVWASQWMGGDFVKEQPSELHHVDPTLTTSLQKLESEWLEAYLRVERNPGDLSAHQNEQAAFRRMLTASKFSDGLRIPQAKAGKSGSGYGDKTGSLRTAIALMLSGVFAGVGAGMFAAGGYFAWAAATSPDTVSLMAVFIPAKIAAAGMLVMAVTGRLYSKFMQAGQHGTAISATDSRLEGYSSKPLMYEILAGLLVSGVVAIFASAVLTFSILTGIVVAIVIRHVWNYRRHEADMRREIDRLRGAGGPFSGQASGSESVVRAQVFQALMNNDIWKARSLLIPMSGSGRTLAHLWEHVLPSELDSLREGDMVVLLDSQWNLLDVGILKSPSPSDGKDPYRFILNGRLPSLNHLNIVRIVRRSDYESVRGLGPSHTARPGIGDGTGSSRTEVALAMSVAGGVMSAAMIGFGSYFAYAAAAAAGTVFAGSVAIPAVLAVGGLVLMGGFIRFFLRIRGEEMIKEAIYEAFMKSHSALDQAHQKVRDLENQYRMAKLTAQMVRDSAARNPGDEGIRYSATVAEEFVGTVQSRLEVARAEHRRLESTASGPAETRNFEKGWLFPSRMVGVLGGVSLMGVGLPKAWMAGTLLSPWAVMVLSGAVLLGWSLWNRSQERAIQVAQVKSEVSAAAQAMEGAVAQAPDARATSRSLGDLVMAIKDRVVQGAAADAIRQNRNNIYFAISA